MVEALLRSWGLNLDYAQRLVADVPGERMVFQPHPGMNHPAWVVCHLCFYHPPILGLARGMPFPDPREAPDGEWYDEGSTPVGDLARYPGKADLMAKFRAGHEGIATALRDAPLDLMQRPVPLDRWKSFFGTIGVALAYLMLNHESTHLGQISVWRRVQGLDRL